MYPYLSAKQRNSTLSLFGTNVRVNVVEYSGGRNRSDLSAFAFASLPRTQESTRQGLVISVLVKKMPFIHHSSCPLLIYLLDCESEPQSRKAS